VKNGKIYYGKQRHKCKHCGWQFVENRKNFKRSAAEKVLIGSLLLQRISLEGICRVLQISPYHLYKYMDELYAETPDDL
jgi:insertion element IS1 protein InsB